MRFRFIVSIALSFLVPFLAAAENATVSVVMNDQVPPYVILDKRSGAVVSGLDVEILTATFERMGIKVAFDAVPRARIPVHMKQSDADAAMHYPSELNEDLCKSRPYRSWIDAAIVRSKDIPGSLDWSERRLTSFPGYHLVLHDELADLVAPGQEIQTIQRTELAVRGLLASRYDAYIGDIVVFRYYAEEILRQGSTFRAAHWFKPIPISLMFSDRALCAAFDAALEEMLISPDFEAILDDYSIDPAIRGDMMKSLGVGE